MGRIALPPGLERRYRVEAQIGEGGMGAIFRAHHVELDRPVAIKVLSRTSFDVRESLERFRDEAVVCARLQHRNIVRLYDYDLAASPPYMAFELVDGPTLKQIQKKLMQQPLAERLELMAAVCDGLDEACSLGVVHRDLKPENILIDHDGTPKVADFGLAKLGGLTSYKTRTGVVVGTPQYMSPEQAAAKDLTPSSDVYAVGILLFELTTGALPFDGPNDLNILLQHVNEVPPLICDRAPGMPDDLVELVDRCLCKKPAGRPKRPAEMARVLRRVARQLAAVTATTGSAARKLRSKGIDTTATVSSVDAVLETRSRITAAIVALRRRPATLVALLVVAAVVAAVFDRSGMTAAEPGFVEDLKIHATGARTVVVTWRCSWYGAGFSAALVRQGASEPEPVPVEVVVHRRADGAPRCPFAVTGKVAGLQPGTRYTLSLVKPDGTTTLAVPVATSDDGPFEPNTRVELGAAGRVDIIVEARTPFRASFGAVDGASTATDAVFNRRAVFSTDLGSLAAAPVVPCRLTSVDGERRDLSVDVVARCTAAARESADEFWRAYEAGTLLSSFDMGFLGPYDKQLFARDEAGQREKRKLAEPFWRALQARFGLEPWYRPLAPLLPGLGALLASPLTGGELRQLLGQASIPLELVDHTLRYRTLPSPPEWERAVDPSRRPYPLAFGTGTLTGPVSDLAFRDTGTIPSPFYCLMDGKHPMLAKLYPDPELRSEVVARTAVLDLTAEQLATARGAELSLTFRMLRLHIITIVELNGRRFVATFSPRERELREYRQASIAQNTDYRISQGLLAAGKPRNIDEARASIEELDEAFPRRTWTIFHPVPLDALQPGRTTARIYPLQARLEGIETITITRLVLHLAR